MCQIYSDFSIFKNVGRQNLNLKSKLKWRNCEYKNQNDLQFFILKI